MTIEQATIRDSVVFRDSVNTWRWYDAIGPHVTKWEIDGVTWSVTPYTKTDSTSGTITVNTTPGVAGGEITFTAGAGENQGTQIQLIGEGFSFAGDAPCYFGIRFHVDDADQTDILLGLSITDTSLLAGLDTGVYFLSVDESASLTFVVEKDTSASSSAVATLSDSTYTTAEFYHDGTTLTYYINGTRMGSVAKSATNFPNDEYLTPSIAFLTGDDSANVLTIDWARAIQLHG